MTDTPLAREIGFRTRVMKDSGYLNTSNTGTISATTGREVLILDDRFKPYNDVVIQNLNTSSDVTAKINFNFSIKVPKGNQITVQVPVSHIEIINDGSTAISANEIFVNYRNDGHRGREALSTVSKLSTIGGFLGKFI